MAKQTGEQKKTNPFLMFLFAVVIPLLIVGIIVIILLNFAGVNVFGWVKDKANEVPVLSSLITTEEEAAIEEYEELLNDRDAQIEELEQLTEDQQFQLDELEQELLYYENNYESLEDISAEASEEEESQTEAQITISSSFANMDNEQAAAILEEMTREDALVILQDVSSKVSGSILEEMNPEVAAELTQMLLETENN
jgi:flagellar motility protein MotE (MotC chaperone)